MDAAKATLYTSIIQLVAGVVPVLVAIGRKDVAEGLEAVLGRADNNYRSVIATAEARGADDAPGGFAVDDLRQPR